VGPCHYVMVRPQVANGEWSLIWRVAANTLNKQLRKADNGWSFSLGVGQGANKSSPSKLAMLQNIVQGIGLGGTGNMDWIDLVLDRDRWLALVTEGLNLRVPQSARNILTG
jgi:hypothetical protein